MDAEESPAALSLPAYEITAALTGVLDPYAELKRSQNAFALEMEGELRAMVRSSEDPLAAALHLAAAGNIIDLGVAHTDAIDIRGAIEQVML